MIRKLLRELGTVRIVLVITAAFLISIALYVTTNFFLRRFTTAGIVVSVAILALAILLLSYFLVQDSRKLDLAERRPAKINSKELRVEQPTAEMVGVDEKLRAEIVERKRAEAALAQQAEEFARSNAFIAALS